MNEFDIKNIRATLNISQESLADKIGVSTRTIQNWESGKVIPKSKHAILRKIISTSGLCMEDQCIYGDSEYKSDETIPLLPLSAQAGLLNEFVLSVKNIDCERIISPIKGADFAISISGDSMFPEYPSGAQVLIKKINEKAFIDWGRVFVLDTCNGTIIKKLMPSDDPSKVMCVSINPAYPSYEISLENVYGIYKVMMCMAMK